MEIIDTRELRDEREELKYLILDSFRATFEHYGEDTDSFEDILFDEEELEAWKEDWEEELRTIEEIDTIENECKYFNSGYGLINENYFTEYCKKEMLVDIGYLPSNIPFYIENNIDWDGVADDLRVDYREVEYRGETYLYK